MAVNISQAKKQSRKRVWWQLNNRGPKLPAPKSRKVLPTAWTK
jgi:hypothetical protein